MKSSRAAARQAQAVERLEAKVDELTKMVQQLLGAQSKPAAPKRAPRKTQ